MPSGGPKKDGSAIVGMNGGPGHRAIIKKHFGPGTKLNPRWVETLMGLPVGWCMPSCEKLNDPEIYDKCDNRTDELRLLGNGVVPATAQRAWETLTFNMEKKNETFKTDTEKHRRD